MNRAEHLAWCKRRAMKYLEDGPHFSPENAVASMLSDLGKHEETRRQMEDSALTMLAISSTKSASDARHFIEGFN